jgi:nitric oxide reductase NorQ protein
MVLSYNPGYQSLAKGLKPSTRQRFASLVFSHPDMETEAEILRSETGLPEEESRRLAEMGAKIRELRGFGIEEDVSTRLLVYVGRLMQVGLSPYAACSCAISRTLTDEAEIGESIDHIVQLYFGRLMPEEEDAP